MEAARPVISRRLLSTFILLWVGVMAVTFWCRPYVSPFQAFIRAESVPLAILVVLQCSRQAALSISIRVVMVASVAAIVAQGLYATLGPLAVELPLAALILAILVAGQIFGSRRADAMAVAIGALTAECIYQYVDFDLRPQGMIPARVVLAFVRSGAAITILGFWIGALVWGGRLVAALAAPLRSGVAVAGIGVAQVVYFHFGVSTQMFVQFAAVGSVMALTFGSAAVLSKHWHNDRLGDVTAVGLFTLVGLRWFYPG
jgi:hypothetical protein